MAIVYKTDLPASVQQHEMVDAMLAGANAKASRVAPCLVSTDPAPSADQIAEARLVLIGAIQRWSEVGAGSFQSQSAGPFAVSVDTRQRSGFNLWPSEIESLQAICKTISSGAFSVDAAPTLGGSHMPWCAVYFGATYCSCGADLTTFEYPLYEGGVLSEDGW